MNKEIFTPLTDSLFPSPWNVRFTTFRFGPMFIHFVLKDMTKIPEELEELLEEMSNIKKDSFEYKKYCMFIIVNDELTYLFYQSNEKSDIWKKFGDTIKELKFGNDLEIKDEQGLFSSLLISYKGINWIW